MSGGRAGTRATPGPPWFPWIALPVAIVGLAVVGRSTPLSAVVAVDDPWLRDWIWPSLSTITRSLDGGGFPLWNPGQYGGRPLLADPRQPVLAPFTWVFLWFPFPDAVLIHGMTCLVGAGFFTVMWTRALGGSVLAALFSVAVYLLGPFAAAASGRPGLETVCCWLPLACWASVSFFRRPRTTPMIPGAVAMSAMLLSGEPVIAVLAVIAAWGHGALSGQRVRPSVYRGEEPHAGARVLLWLGWILALSAPQVLPVAWTLFTEGWPSGVTWTGFPACWVLPSRWSLVVEHVLTPGTGVRWGDPGFSRHLAYMHPLVLLMSVEALADPRKRDPGLSLVGLAMLLVPAIMGEMYFPGAPTWPALALIAHLGLAGLSGLGSDRLFGPEPDPKRRRRLILSLFLGGGVYVLTGGAGGWRVLVFSFCCLGALAWGSPYMGSVFRLFLLLVTATTLHGELVTPMNLPGRLRGLSRADLVSAEARAILRQQGVQGRIAVLPPLPDDVVGCRNPGMVLGIPFTGGWNYPARPGDMNLSGLWRDNDSEDHDLDVDMLERFCHAYAVNALLAEPGRDMPLEGKGFSRVASVATADLWVRDRPLSRWTLYGQWVAVPDRASVVETMRATDLDTVCVLRLDTAGARMLADRMALGGHSGGRPVGTVFPLADRMDRLELRVQSNAPALLVVADAWDAGWTCRVNGRLTAIMPANGMGWAVMVPAGESTVVCACDPLPWKLGMTMALLLLGGLCLYGLILLAGARGARGNGR